MAKIKIIIADDHPMLRQGIKQILELENDFDVVALASNGEEAVRLVKQYKPDIVLMDINMPDVNGIEALQSLKTQEIPSKVVMLTIHDDREYLFKALQTGAEGYVLKDAEPAVLVDAIRNIHKGQSFIQPTMTKELVKEFNRVTLHERNARDENALTERETEVLGLISEGLLNKEIAQKLFISEKTVKNHVSNIFRKLQVSDRTQAAVYAIKHKINR